MGKKLTRKEINAMSYDEWLAALHEAINELETCLKEEFVKTDDKKITKEKNDGLQLQEDSIGSDHHENGTQANS